MSFPFPVIYYLSLSQPCRGIFFRSLLCAAWTQWLKSTIIKFRLGYHVIPENHDCIVLLKLSISIFVFLCFVILQTQLFGVLLAAASNFLISVSLNIQVWNCFSLFSCLYLASNSCYNLFSWWSSKYKFCCILGIFPLFNGSLKVPCCSCWQCDISQPVLCCDSYTGTEYTFVNPPPYNVS